MDNSIVFAKTSADYNGLYSIAIAIRQEQNWRINWYEFVEEGWENEAEPDWKWEGNDVGEGIGALWKEIQQASEERSIKEFYELIEELIWGVYEEDDLIFEESTYSNLQSLRPGETCWYSGNEGYWQEVKILQGKKGFLALLKEDSVWEGPPLEIRLKHGNRVALAKWLTEQGNGKHVLEAVLYLLDIESDAEPDIEIEEEDILRYQATKHGVWLEVKVLPSEGHYPNLPYKPERYEMEIE